MLKIHYFILVFISVHRSTHTDEGSNIYRFGDLPSGPLEDAKCNIETVEEANHKQLNNILKEIINTTYFRLFKVDLNKKCHFWEKEKKDTCGSKEKPITLSSGNPFGSHAKKPPTLCSLKTKQGGKRLPWGPESAPVTKSTLLESSVPKVCNDATLPEFWLDLCGPASPVILRDAEVEYVDLFENPEQYTGYNGTRLWDAIYHENCFGRQREGGRDAVIGEMCYEERVLYRLFSGMHSAINIQIALNYYPPRKGKRDRWEPNPQRYFDLFHHHPERIKNLYFTFVVLLRAMNKASSALERYPITIGKKVEDAHTKKLMRRLLDTHILHSCGPLFSAFDESQLFQQGKGPTAVSELKRRFKGVFRNVTKILDCVTCQKCKLHGKVDIKGLGTALRILLLPEYLISLLREEVVSLINTIAKFSDAIINYKDLVRMAFDLQKQKSKEKELKEQALKEKKLKEEEVKKQAKEVKKEPKKREPVPLQVEKKVPKSPSGTGIHDVAFDIILDIVSKSAIMGKITSPEEDILVDAAIAKDERLKALIKHYAYDPQKFLRHALRVISNGEDVQTTTVGRKSDQPNAIIVGSGLSGLTAALTLVDRGANVVIVEKQAFMGGNSAYASSGINAAKNTTGNLDTNADNAERFAQDSFKSGGMSGNPDHPSHRLIPVLSYQSFDALEWTKKRVGVDLNKIGQLGGHSYPRTYRPSTGMAGSELIFAISKIIKSHSGEQVDLRMKTSAKEIIVDGSGKAVGLKVQVEGESKTEDILADNVIIATGGFAADRTDTSLLTQYRPDLAHFATTNGKFATGDGHKMLLGAGAGFIDMSNVQVHPTAFIDMKYPNASRKTLCAELLRGIGGILLNKKGERFVDELGTRKHIVEQMEAQGNEDLHFTILLSPAMASQADKHVPHYYKKGLLVRFDSLKDVANWMKVELKTLENTVDSYNSFATLGTDPYGKKYFKNSPFPKQRSKQPDEEYFYAGVVTPALHYCMGGVSVDTSGRVLKTDGSVFQGLYAAGEIIGGLHGVNRLGGNALTECVVFGRLVGGEIVLNVDEAEKDSQGDVAAETVEKDTGEGTTVTSVEETKPGKKQITWAELAKHSSATDCWVAVDGKVYDLTDFLEEHPAGPQSIVDLAGKDGTEVFDSVHARSMLDDFDIIGELVV